MELRKDYVLDRWVIIAPQRGKRPVDYSRESASSSGSCVFCPGSEHLTPKEIGRLGTKGSWRMRWFANLFPAVGMDAKQPLHSGSLLVSSAAYGSHEIIVETPSRTRQLWDLGLPAVIELFGVYMQRINALASAPGIRYVSVFKNHGGSGGASLAHSHSQVIATGFIPLIIKEESISVRNGICRYCMVIEAERKGARLCFENRSAVAFSPYASRFNYELWIFPKRHATALSDLSRAELRDFAEILHRSLRRLKSIGVSYNYFLHCASSGSKLHFHLELAPRIAAWAGFELGSGVTINTVSPEAAAGFYRQGA